MLHVWVLIFAFNHEVPQVWTVPFQDETVKSCAAQGTKLLIQHQATRFVCKMAW